MYITKANGQREPFDEHKFLNSVRRAHIARPLRHRVLEEVQSKLYDGIPTNEIYTTVNTYLSSNAPHGSCMYNLKQAIMDLGRGYPFERYIGKLWSGKDTKRKSVLLFAENACRTRSMSWQKKRTNIILLSVGP